MNQRCEYVIPTSSVTLILIGVKRDENSPWKADEKDSEFWLLPFSNIDYWTLHYFVEYKCFYIWSWLFRWNVSTTETESLTCRVDDDTQSQRDWESLTESGCLLK